MSQLEKIYGVHAVQALLQHHPKRVKQIWLSEGRSEPRLETLLALAAENRVPVGQAERRELPACALPMRPVPRRWWCPRTSRRP